MTVKTPVPPPIPDQLDALLRRLRMPYVRKAAPEVIATAASQRWEPAEVLRVLLAEEAAGRDGDDRDAPARVRAARRQDVRCLGRDRLANSQDVQQALRTLESIGRAEALCVCGPSGTGKSHLVEALGSSRSIAARPSPGTHSRASRWCCAATAPTTASPRRSAA
jgi:DNA replication protein DnaC